MAIATPRDASPSLRPTYINTMVDDLAGLDTRVDSLEAGGGGGGGGGTGTVGPRGPAGPTGATGPRGATGATGATGAAGATGATGATGPAGPGVAAGGTTGQVLAKTSNADYATGWINAPTGGGSGGDTTTVAVTAVTEDYTLQLTDAGKVIEGDTTSAGFIVFIPADADVAFPVGTLIEIDNVGPNSLNIVPSGTVTLQYHSVTGNHALANQFEAATIRKRATNTWIAVGALS
jgi:predicted RNA-binding protein with TRAM domain